MAQTIATDIPRRVAGMTEIERRYAEAMHEECGTAIGKDPTSGMEQVPHGLEAHEPFDIEEGDAPWSEFERRLARHGLMLVKSESFNAVNERALALHLYGIWSRRMLSHVKWDDLPDDVRHAWDHIAQSALFWART